jgi:hypothetical protein
LLTPRCCDVKRGAFPRRSHSPSEGKVFDKEGNLVAHRTEACLIMGQHDGAASQAKAQGEK